MRLIYTIFLLSLYVLDVFGVATFTNPVKNPNGSDPFMVYSNGYYYLMTTTWSNLQISRATTMAGLKTATPKVVWTDSTASRCCNMWAPEIHQYGGVWYIYYTAGPSGNYDGNRINAIKGSSNDIWGSTWSYAGQLVPANRNKAALDGTVLTHSSGSYLIWSSWEDGVGQCLYIAKMSSATSIGNAVRISAPTNSWEKVGAAVNEGPAPLYYGGRTWIVFSASLCSTTGYSLGSLELTGSDPLQASSWTKYNAGPIFSAANGNYGVSGLNNLFYIAANLSLNLQPGHNGFFTTPSGSVYIVYHASPSSSVTCDGNRRTMVQPVYWHTDGSPNLGQPRALTDNVPEPA